MDTIMPMKPMAVSLKSRALLFISVACLLSCHKKQEAPDSGPAQAIDSVSGAGSAPIDSASARNDSVPAPKAETGPVRLAFTTRPPAQGYPGRHFLYRPAL